METDYLNQNADTTRSLRTLSKSLSRLSNDIRNTIGTKSSTVSFKDEPVSSPLNGTKGSTRSFFNDSGYSTTSLSNSRSKIMPSMRSIHNIMNNSNYDIRQRPSSNISNYNYQESSHYVEPEVTQIEFNAMRYFPVTMSSSYAMTIPTQSADEPTMSSIKKKHSRSGILKSNQSGSLSPYDNYQSESYSNINLDDLHAMVQRAPTMVSAVPELSPFEEHLTSLRLKRLQIEEDRLRELKRREELENLRGPEPKWYEKKDQTFHYEAHKNTQLIRSREKWDDLLKQRESLILDSNKMDALYSTTPVF